VVFQETVGFCVTAYVMAQCGVIKVNYSISIKLQVGPTKAVYEMESTMKTFSFKKINELAVRHCCLDVVLCKLKITVNSSTKKCS